MKCLYAFAACGAPGILRHWLALARGIGGRPLPQCGHTHRIHSAVGLAWRRATALKPRCRINNVLCAGAHWLCRHRLASKQLCGRCCASVPILKAQACRPFSTHQRNDTTMQTLHCAHPRFSVCQWRSCSCCLAVEWPTYRVAVMCNEYTGSGAGANHCP